MIEHMKSVLLVALVGLSLFQSYLLVYSKPEIESNQPTEYIKTERIGTQLAVEDLLYPSELILHFGDETHTVLAPEHTFYKMIMESISAKTFDGLVPATKWLVDWDEMRKSRQGMELYFKQGIPMEVLKELIQIEDKELLSYNIIHRVWFVVNESGEEVRTFFVPDNGIRMFETASAIVSVRELQRFVELGAYVTRYDFEPQGGLYLPSQEIEMIQYEVGYSTFSPEQLQNSLFVNPRITRNIVERDGTEIYTDGKRGLQLNHDAMWMNFSDPVAPGTGSMNVLDNLYSAVQFVNQHGGWNGTYSIEHFPELIDSSFGFQQYYGGFPIVDLREMGIGYIHIDLSNAVVSSYERTLINLNTEPETKKQAQLPGGESLRQQLQSYERRLEVIHVFAGYRPEWGEDAIRLWPAWIVKLQDGSFDYLTR